MKKFVLILALALTACKKTGTGALVDPALSTLVPSDTTMLVGVRVEDLLKTPLYKKFLANRTLAPLDEFSREFEIDPRKDLWELLFISNGKEQVVLGRGKFSNEAEPRVLREAQGAKRFSYRGVTFIGDDRNAVMLLGPSLAGVGDTAGLKRVIDARDKSNGPPKVLENRMKEVPRDAAVWSVYAGAPIALPEGTPANMGNVIKILNSIESGAFSLIIQTAITGKATGIAANDGKAKELHDSLRGLLGLARLMGAKDDVRMNRLMDGLRITQEGRNVNLYIDAQEDAVNTIANLLTEPQGRKPATVAPLK